MHPLTAAVLRPLSFLLLMPILTAATAVPGPPDRGDGTYRNPVLPADYSDPDAVRVGDDYWLVSSSFSHVPGLPVLHSRDLVNWQLVAHALPRLVPEEVFRTPQHGKGVWAPALRHHAGKFWLYYPDPDFGIYLVTATDPRGPWSEPVLVKAGKGLIDPCPLWDDDGTLYLIHAWAKSRSGINNVLTLLRLHPDGRSVAEDFGIVIDGHKVDAPGFRTLEGPKLYRRDGWYYVFAPAGGVTEGWQSVFRARSIRGPYEHRIVLDQGTTAVNGPHQGALLDTQSGEWWFLHFQDQAAYGRVVHLQPVAWRDGWPVIGDDADGDGRGQPFAVHRKPAVAAQPIAVPATSDEFSGTALGLQWQWQANPGPDWASLAARPGWLRLAAQPWADRSLYRAPHLLLQKFPAREFIATARLELSAAEPGDTAGLVVFGYAYAWIGLRATAAGRADLVVVTMHDAPGKAELAEQVIQRDLAAGPVHLRVAVRDGARCSFAWSADGTTYAAIDGEFQATVGHWVGAKVGLFAHAAAAPGGHADLDWFRVTAPADR